MRIVVRTEPGSDLDPRKAEEIAAPCLATLQEEIDAELAATPASDSEDECLRAILDRLRERGVIYR